MTINGDDELDAFIVRATNSMQKTLASDVDIEERLRDVHRRAESGSAALDLEPAPSRRCGSPEGMIPA